MCEDTGKKPPLISRIHHTTSRPTWAVLLTSDSAWYVVWHQWQLLDGLARASMNAISSTAFHRIAASSRVTWPELIYPMHSQNSLSSNLFSLPVLKFIPGRILRLFAAIFPPNWMRVLNRYAAGKFSIESITELVSVVHWQAPAAETHCIRIRWWVVIAAEDACLLNMQKIDHEQCIVCIQEVHDRSNKPLAALMMIRRATFNCVPRLIAILAQFTEPPRVHIPNAQHCETCLSLSDHWSEISLHMPIVRLVRICFIPKSKYVRRFP